jgi:hypothetical protein
MNAIPSGMIQAAQAPDATRAMVSVSRLCAKPHSMTITAHNDVAMAMTRYFSKRSPTGPVTSCIEPCITV